MRAFPYIFLVAWAAMSPSATAAAAELKLDRAAFEAGRRELSGATMLPAKRGTAATMLVVADAPADHVIFEARPSAKAKPERFSLVPWLDLSKLEGFSDYRRILQAATSVEEKDRRFDLEGIAACGDNEIYLVNERVRHVLKVVDRKRLEHLTIDLSRVPGADKGWLEAGGANAGFEGVAVDCSGRRLFLAKERDPRRLVVVDLKGGSVSLLPEPPASSRAGQRVIDFRTGEGLMSVGPDAADLFFADGALYILERNTFEVSKVDSRTGALLARFSYFKAEQGLYETGEPFGLAEALFVTPTHVVVGLDNNESPLTHKGAKTYELSGRHGVFFYFKRPKGF